MELFNYFRSSASWRVRIALALKGLDYDYRSVHLVRNEQHAEPFATASVSHLVPLLKLDEGSLLTQSLAIIEYLDETHPEPPLLPAEPVARAQVRALAQDIACEIHPLNNLRVLRYLVRELQIDEDAKKRWYRHWVESGLAVVEQRLRTTAGRFCFGERPGLADCVLVPQVFNAQRFDCKLDALPEVMRVHANCMAHEAFAGTQPSECPDAE
ncbi:maleylacetoacetate isomerase [Roseateles violae]|uniref:Maleylacetoacetate isomerase n=1 Tax=Roseateles violae TaxID=3058042 RepID=A0ABT8DZ20_9BURK|nr:maleylacetoacetate isomerase [Pelomonas sp. PFR6]MDN3922841.1 maleylacetoacetate isomerase [Pelomonas sp. PFR6]